MMAPAMNSKAGGSNYVSRHHQPCCSWPASSCFIIAELLYQVPHSDCHYLHQVDIPPCWPKLLHSDFKSQSVRARVTSFPLRGSRKPPGRNPRKMGRKNTKFPSPVRPPKLGKIAEKLQNCIFGVILPLFAVNFPCFRGSDRGGDF